VGKGKGGGETEREGGRRWVGAWRGKVCVMGLGGMDAPAAGCAPAKNIRTPNIQDNRRYGQRAYVTACDALYYTRVLTVRIEPRRSVF